MVMEHKAYLFNFQAFDIELKSTLEKALVSNNCEFLVRFISENLRDLTDPYEGEPLDDKWMSLIEQPDAHQLGDFALTKFYDPSADIGLGAGWEEIQETITGDSEQIESPILGSILGLRENPFDPGKMGSYFQSADQVSKNRKFLSTFDVDTDSIRPAIGLLSSAERAKTGLYVTF